MSTLREVLDSKIGLLSGEPVTNEVIKEAEKELNIKFAKEYREYLQEYGIIAYGGHEITGLCDDDRTNVVIATKRLRNGNRNIPSDYYVVEEANIDGIVIWQETSGSVYMTKYDSAPQKIFKSFCEYLEKQK